MKLSIKLKDSQDTINNLDKKVHIERLNMKPLAQVKASSKNSDLR
jgi:hypothetical protein